MKNNKLAGIAFALLLVGCGAPMRYSEFSGRRDWPSVAGAMADNAYAVPVYSGWPPKPFTVLGSIRFADPNTYWDDGDTKHAARIAKRRGADAMILRSGGEFGVEGIAGAAADEKVVWTQQRTALAIKWKTEEELLREDAALARQRAEFMARHPGMQPSKELFKLAVACASQTPSEGDADALLVKVLAGPDEVGHATWLLRGTIQTASFASTFTQEVFGVATVRQQGDAVTIVTVPGMTELSFSGTLSGGALSGQLGVRAGHAIFSAKAEGVLLDNRISLTANGRTADGTVQSNFNLSH